LDKGWIVSGGNGLSPGLEQGSTILVSSIFTANCAMAATAVPAEKWYCFFQLQAKFKSDCCS